MARFADIHTTLKRTADASVEPVTLDQAKVHCRIDHDEEDSLLSMLIKSARRYCETRQKRQYVNATWTLTLDAFPQDAILLRVCPVSSVSSITYLDEDGTQQTLSSSLYRVDTTSEPARITPAYDEVWPNVRGVMSQVVVTFTAGYGTTPSSVPDDIKTAILMMVDHAYENRSAVEKGEFKAVPMAVDAWLASETWSLVH